MFHLDPLEVALQLMVSYVALDQLLLVQIQVDFLATIIVVLLPHLVNTLFDLQ
jgi:hypothetical protein